MDSVALLRKVVDETGRLVDGIDESQLANPTPCTEWTVRDLVNHLTGGATMFALSAESGSVPDDVVAQLLGGDNLGSDFKGAFHAAADKVLDAYEQPGVMDKTVKLPFGEMPAGVALDIAIFDVATHACDIAKATGQKFEADEVGEAALAIGKQVIGPELRQPGVFDAEQQPVSPDAPIADRLMAFAGRKL